MIPWETVDAGEPGGPDEALSLHRRGDEWSIRTGGAELMNSRRFGSERALAELAADALGAGSEFRATGSGLRTTGSARRVLIGGLGLGHTLAAALVAFPKASLSVAEISERVIEWNRGLLAPLAGHPLDDPRSAVFVGDVADALRSAAGEAARERFDAVLLDVDNGPEALSRRQNAFLYSPRGIATALAALAPRGVLGVWSAGPSAAFERRLHAAGCRVETHRVSPRGEGRGRARHSIWIARRAGS